MAGEIAIEPEEMEPDWIADYQKLLQLVAEENYDPAWELYHSEAHHGELIGGEVGEVSRVNLFTCERTLVKN